MLSLLRTSTESRAKAAGGRELRDPLLVLVIGLALWSLLAPGAYDLRIVTMTIVFATAAIGLNVLVGYAGIVSVGHAAFMAIGGYVWARLGESMGGGALLAGIALGAVVAAFIGWLCLRFRGYYLAVATLALGLLALVLARNWIDVTGGEPGLRGVPQIALPGVSGGDEIFVLALCGFVVFFFLQNTLRASSIGAALVASRWNEETAGSVGVSVRSVRVAAFVLSALPACFAGALLTQLFHYANPDLFDVSASINLIAIPIIAGRGWRWAPLVGAAIVIALPEYVRFLSDYRLMVYGGILTAIALFFPRGVWGMVEYARAALPRLGRPRTGERLATSEGG